MWRFGCKPEEEKQQEEIPKMPAIATSLIFQTVAVFSTSRTIQQPRHDGRVDVTYTMKKFYQSCKDAFQAGATTVDKDELLECNGHYFLVVENKVREVEFGTEYQVSKYVHSYRY